MSNPGTSQRKQLRLLVPHLNERQRHGFHYAVCRRLASLYVHFFGNQDLHAAVCKLVKDAALGRAVDVNEAEILRMRLESQIERLRDSDDDDYPMEISKALAASLQAFAPREWDTIDHVYLAGQDTAGTTRRESMDADIEEEAQSQLTIIGTIRAMAAPTESELDALAIEPPWVTRLARGAP